MKQPHTRYPVRGTIPEVAPDGTSHYLFVAVSLPSYAPPLIEFTTKTNNAVEDDSVSSLARIALNNRNVVQHGLIQLSPTLQFRTEETDTLNRLPSEYKIRWVHHDDSILVMDPLQEQTIITSTKEGALRGFTATNEAIVLASVRALAMQHTSTSRP